MVISKFPRLFHFQLANVLQIDLQLVKVRPMTFMKCFNFPSLASSNTICFNTVVITLFILSCNNNIIVIII